jgi:Chaperone of endosialidase
MKTTNKLFILSLLFAAGGFKTSAQNTFPTGAGTSVGIGTAAPASRFQVIGGDSRFGSATNYGQHAIDGDLTFTGTADYLVGGNKYAFRFAGDQDYGLFFNQTSLRYEYRDAAAAAIFYASTVGDGFFAKGVQIGNSTINTAGNIRWNGTDFEGYNGTVWKSFTVTGGGAETDPEVGANTNNYLSKWNGSALVTSNVFDNATNVGIGTASPTEKLDVAGNIKSTGTVTATGGNSTNWNSAFGWGNHATSGYLTSETDPQVGTNTNNYLSKWNGSALVTSNVFDNATNVGIGTAAPTEKLDVLGNIKSSGTVTSTGGNSTNWNSAFGWGNHATSGYLTSETDPQVGINTSNYLSKWNGSALVTSNVFDNATNVGIGTAAPTEKLDVAGNIKSSGTVTASGGNSSNWNSAFGWGNHATAGYISSESDPQVGTNTTNFLPKWNGTSLGTGTIYDNGNIGIGTSAPTSKLSIIGSSITSLAGNGSFQIGTTSFFSSSMIADENEIQARFGTSAATLYLQNWGGDLRLCDGGGSATFGGNVGIGTANPSYKLDVFGRMRLQSNSNSAGTWFMNYDNTVDAAFLGMQDDNHLGLYGNSGAGWGLNMNCTNGFVGIGTASSAYTLDVVSPNYTAMKVKSGVNGGTSLIVDADDLTGTVWAIQGIAPTSGFAGYFQGNVYCTSLFQASDERLKQNIKPLEKALDKVMKLETKTYNFRTEGLEKMNLPAGNQFGFISQNMERIFPELVRLNPAKGEEQPVEFKAVNYVGMIPILTEAMQEQQNIITTKTIELDKVKEELVAVKTDMEVLKTSMAKMEESLSQCCNNYATSNINLNATSEEKAALEQNAPNPFSEKTTINYYIPTNVKNAMVKIYSLNGDAIKTINIAQTGKGSVEVNGGSLAAGTYTYQLILDGKTIDTKLMVITK